MWVVCHHESVPASTGSSGSADPESEPWKSAGDYPFNKHPQVTLSLRTPVSHVDFKHSCEECFSFLNLKHSLIVSLLRVEKFLDLNAKPWRGRDMGFIIVSCCFVLRWGRGSEGLITWDTCCEGASVPNSGCPSS